MVTKKQFFYLSVTCLRFSIKFYTDLLKFIFKNRLEIFINICNYCYYFLFLLGIFRGYSFWPILDAGKI